MDIHQHRQELTDRIDEAQDRFIQEAKESIAEINRSINELRNQHWQTENPPKEWIDFEIHLTLDILHKIHNTYNGSVFNMYDMVGLLADMIDDSSRELGFELEQTNKRMGEMEDTMRRIEGKIDTIMRALPYR